MRLPPAQRAGSCKAANRDGEREKVERERQGGRVCICVFVLGGELPAKMDTGNVVAGGDSESRRLPSLG